MTRITRDSEDALEQATLALFRQMGWEAVNCFDEAFGDAPGGGTPTGVVTVTEGVTNCTGSASGSGSCTLTLTQTGTVTLTASYAGDGNFNASLDTELHQVIAVLYLPLIQKN